MQAKRYLTPESIISCWVVMSNNNVTRVVKCCYGDGIYQYIWTRYEFLQFIKATANMSPSNQINQQTQRQTQNDKHRQTDRQTDRERYLASINSLAVELSAGVYQPPCNVSQVVLRVRLTPTRLMKRRSRVLQHIKRHSEFFWQDFS